MESASESPSAWSDLMVLSDDSDLLSDEYISHNKQISPPIQNEMIEGESPRCDNVSAHVDRMSMSTLCPSPPRLAATGHSSTSSSSLSLLGPPLNNATLSPISPPAEFKDESDFKDTESDFKDTEESDFRDTSRTERGVDESGAESCSTLESYSNKLSNLVLQDTKKSLCKTPSVSTTWKFQSNPTVVPSSHLIVRPKPTRARTSVNAAAPFQSTSSHRQSDLTSSSSAGPGASDASLPIYSAPIDTLDTRSRSRMRANNSNCLMMAHVHEILNDLYATPTGTGHISITHDSLSLTRRRKKNRGSNGGAESAGLKHKASIASTSSGSSSTGAGAAAKHFHNSSSFVINIKKPKKSSLKHSHHQKSKHHTASSATHATPSVETGHTKPLRAKRKHQLKLKRFKQTLCRLFTFKTSSLPKDDELGGSNTASESVLVLDVSKTCFSERALPPVPGNAVGGASVATEGEGEGEDGEDGACAFNMDFASSIEKVKDYGWYWGPISSEAAEKILSTEPDGSFIVRDSSDDHYIFSLTFKLNACVRHVRIEHYQGNFSFGSCTKFKSHTIVDFIENAVEHSRSGRYLFFLHRRPILGPMRVQLLHPVSRFKQVQSLQHMCRFVILKIVRKDHINQLPLPDRLQAYLNTPHYYCESSEQFDATAPTTTAPSEES
uniref:Suppressor of cytokine signaling 7 n=2 Tax=Cacopsylla melanoneura TaxID=428564 RepID=A0A8D8V5I8_9HEMI